MIKVLMVSPAGERGGLEVVILNLLRCIDRSRFEPHVLLLEDGPFANDVAETGTAMHVIPSGRVRSVGQAVRAITATVKLIRQQGIQLIHTHNAKAHLYGGLAARMAGVPCLFHLHAAIRPRWSRDGFVSLLSVLVPAQQTISCSRHVAETFRQVWKSKRDVHCIHNGVWMTSTEEPNGDASVRDVRSALGVAPEAMLVATACRLQRWKGVHVFLDAAARVLQDFPNAHFMVVGGTLFGLEDDYAEQLHQQAERLGIAASIHFTGYRPDAYRYLQAADLVVHTHLEPEPFGMVIAEAMMLGKPVIASNIGGPKEMIEDQRTGLLVPPSDAEATAEAICTLLADAPRRQHMGSASAAKAASDFGAAQMTRRMEAMYESMMDRPTAAPVIKKAA